MNDTRAEYLPQLDGWRKVFGCGCGLRAMWRGSSIRTVRYHKIQYKEIYSSHKGEVIASRNWVNVQAEYEGEGFTVLEHHR
jgi:hypothetical protein